jgi:hypothetical protein
MTITQTMLAWLTAPASLLLLFFLAAAAAFIWFGVLTRKKSTPRREDWKKFLSSFSGTALALSVGFGSLMLQQHNQLRQKKTDENSQIKSRLIYSVAQKKLELTLFLLDRLRPATVAKICDVAMDEQARDAVLRDVAAPLDNADTKFFRDFFDKFFATEGYDRSVLSRLMKETSLPSRIDQDALSSFLSYELELNSGAPKLMPQILEFIATDQSAVFCSQVKKLPRSLKFVIRDVMRLQLLSCATLAIIELPTEESVSRSGLILATIVRFRLGSEQENPVRIQTLIDDLEKNVQDKADFQTCLKFADVELAQMPDL